MYGGTKSEMERLLKDAQKLTGVKYDINNLADVYSAIHAIQGELGITGTTAKEASETLAGSYGMMKSALTDYMGALTTGGDVSGKLTNLFGAVGTFLKNLLPAAGRVVKGLIVSIVSNFPQIVLTGYKFITQFVLGIFKKLPEAMRAMAKWLSTFVSGLGKGKGEFFKKATELVVSFITGILKSLPEIASAAIGLIAAFIKAIFTGFPKVLGIGLNLAWEFIKGIAGGAADIARAVWNAIVGAFEAVKNKVKEIYDTIVNWFSNIFSNLQEIENKNKSIRNSLNRSTGGRFSGNAGWFAFAKGGIAPRTINFGTSVIGEAGPEAILPLEPFWNHLANFTDTLTSTVAQMLIVDRSKKIHDAETIKNNVTYQTVNIYQPVKSPAEMSRELRKQQIMLGLEGR